jgi:1-pyrroline-5-carboxylate dehydrogenase
MINAIVRVPPPKNEPVLSYAPNTPERTELKETLRRFSSERVEIPLVIGGKQVRTGKTSEVRMPHRHSHVLGTYHEADSAQVEKAIAAAMAAKNAWANTAFHERAATVL